MSLVGTGGPREDSEANTPFCLGELCPTRALGTGTWGTAQSPGGPQRPRSLRRPDEDCLRSPRARPRRAVPNGLAHRPTSIIISASRHAGTWGAASLWLGSLSRGPRAAANDDEPHLLQGSPATIVILHFSCNTCSVRAWSWRGREPPSASAARAPSPSLWSSAQVQL